MSGENTCLAARHHVTGVPAEVVAVDSVPVVAPGAGEVRVRMLYAPVNPADLNMIEGRYGASRPLPDIPGNEGCGRVIALGEGVPSWWEGRLVLVPSRAWTQAGVWKISELVPVPAGLEAAQACVLRVNPPTAWLLLHHCVELRTGDTVLQNAATSAVGRAVIEIARHAGWRTCNVVRRPEAADELRALGADFVAVDDENLADSVSGFLSGAAPRLGLNAVGGAPATRLAGLLAQGGTLVTYGAMSKEALKIPNAFLIFRDLVFRGFWLTRWLKEASASQRDAVFGEIFRLAAAGCFHPSVAAEFPLSGVREALALASSGQARGKVILRLAE